MLLDGDTLKTEVRAEEAEKVDEDHGTDISKIPSRKVPRVH